MVNYLSYCYSCYVFAIIIIIKKTHTTYIVLLIEKPFIFHFYKSKQLLAFFIPLPPTRYNLRMRSAIRVNILINVCYN